ncbi:coatomer subunit delta-like [Saccostrea cucullata]|uniref:coatomer subunit delta-like n=2 Tax=Saccostrea cuccullata TaxID=36930 RepID=UPI002ED562A7
MVLLAAAVCNKSGKAIISRQFVEMTRSRIEGLLAAFPKLMSSGKQHTFVETESVRYVYQPLEKLYMLLITTKASNILEDLETLRLFARVIPEYCKNFDEQDIVDQAFPLIFAFDEIVALGYRESVNLAQIRTFTEMESHEEAVFKSVRETQEKEAKIQMQKKAKELQAARRENQKSGRSGGFGGGFGSGSFTQRDNPIIDSVPMDTPKPSYTAPASKPSSSRNALRLGSKKKDVDTFVGQLESEGEKVGGTKSSLSSAVAKQTTPVKDQEGVHIAVEEKISLTAGRDGGLQNMEVHGLVKVKVNDETYGKIKVNVLNNDKKGIQLQTHPNVDKKLFNSSSCIALKNQEKSFPLNTDVGVLKWRFQTQDEDMMPLQINCWPNDTGSGCDVNIEYELKQTDLELNDVTILIPVPSGVGAPVVGECDGEYNFDSRKAVLQWTLPVIDASNESGSMEFSIAGHPDDFFPVTVNFISKKSYCDLQITEVQNCSDDSPVKFSSEVVFYVDRYEIV